MDLQLTGKVAIVTGGSVGIGKAIARELAREGVNVVICARREGLLEEAAQELSAETGGRVIAVPADTTSNQSVQGLVDATMAEFGRVDILVNNAAYPGGLVGGGLDDASDEDLLADLNTKVVGYLRCAKAVAPIMREQGWGRIINIGGMASRNAGTYSGVRNLALVHMTKTLSNELGPHGVNVNVVHPGTTRTERTGPMHAEQAEREGVSVEDIEQRTAQGMAIRKIVDATEIAYVVAFLASPLAIAVTGEAIAASGGVGQAVQQ
jgi:NAD(P)-dependent dehydrogenase (short-subunit alcohol dehydrogenase family)